MLIHLLGQYDVTYGTDIGKIYVIMEIELGTQVIQYFFNIPRSAINLNIRGII